MASAHEVIWEQCFLPSHEKLGATGCEISTGLTADTATEGESESTYVGGMSSKSVDVKSTPVVASVATLGLELLVKFSVLRVL